jgi:hypothetical protein
MEEGQSVRGRGWVKFEEEEEGEEAGHRANQEAPGSLQVLLVHQYIPRQVWYRQYARGCQIMCESSVEHFYSEFSIS